MIPGTSADGLSGVAPTLAASADVLGGVDEAIAMTHMNGSRLGPYEILAPLGHGGMGEQAASPITVMLNWAPGGASR